MRISASCNTPMFGTSTRPLCTSSSTLRELENSLPMGLAKHESTLGELVTGAGTNHLHRIVSEARRAPEVSSRVKAAACASYEHGHEERDAACCLSKVSLRSRPLRCGKKGSVRYLKTWPRVVEAPRLQKHRPLPVLSSAGQHVILPSETLVKRRTLQQCREASILPLWTQGKHTASHVTVLASES